MIELVKPSGRVHKELGSAAFCWKSSDCEKAARLAFILSHNMELISLGQLLGCYHRNSGGRIELVSVGPLRYIIALASGIPVPYWPVNLVSEASRE